MPTPTARRSTILRVLRTVWGSRPSCQARAGGLVCRVLGLRRARSWGYVTQLYFRTKLRKLQEGLRGVARTSARGCYPGARPANRVLRTC